LALLNERLNFTERVMYRVAPKSKPLPYDQKIVLNHIKACHWD